MTAIGLKNNTSPKAMVVFILLLACINPLGIGIGWNLTESGALATGILKSLSAGTFLYIALMEILNEEF